MEASRVTTAPSAFELGGVRQVVADYVTLTKPKVQLLLLLTTVTTMYIAGDPSIGLVLVTLLGGSLSAGGAGAVNHWYDRDIDAQMARTADRPVPSGRVAPHHALIFGCTLAALAIVVFWTPPHFWALSLLMKDEYARVGVPMLPVVRGERETRRQILLYSILLYAVSQLPFCAGAFGMTYLVASVLLGAAFIYGAVRLTRHPERRNALRLYLFSLAYLAALFAAMVADVRL